MKQPKVLSDKELRIFGIVFPLLTLVIFSLIFPSISLKKNIFIALCFIFIIMLILSCVKPQSLKIIYNLWINFGQKIGEFNSKIIMCILFYLLFTPFGVFLKLIRKNVINNKFDKNASTYKLLKESIPSENIKRIY